MLLLYLPLLLLLVKPSFGFHTRCCEEQLKISKLTNSDVKDAYGYHLNIGEKLILSAFLGKSSYLIDGDLHIEYQRKPVDSILCKL